VWKNILTTVAARYFTAVLNLTLIVVNGKVLGRQTLGLTGVIIASTTLAVVFNGIFCGNSIVYFLNRYNLRYVSVPAYLWAFIGSLLASVIMCLAGLFPADFFPAVFALACLLSLNNANSSMLLGFDRLKAFNLLYVTTGLLTFIFVISTYFIVGLKTAEGYLAGLTAANAVAVTVGLCVLIPYWRADRAAIKPFTAALREMTGFGLTGLVDNLAENLTSRANYFILSHTGGYGNVGLLEAGTKMTESLWHISNSVSYLEYKSVARTMVLAEQKRVTLRLFKLTFCALSALMAAIVCVPEWVYTEYLLTEEFAGVRGVIASLSVGIVAFGCNRILSHFFIGSGKIRYSACCSVLGLVILLMTGIVLIPRNGVSGAAACCSIAYCCMLCFSMIVFSVTTRTRPAEWLPSKDDWRRLKKRRL
jgi:O-antigen/teichoic acid export membrane protein